MRQINTNIPEKFWKCILKNKSATSETHTHNGSFSMGARMCMEQYIISQYLAQAPQHEHRLFDAFEVRYCVAFRDRQHWTNGALGIHDICANAHRVSTEVQTQK